MIKYTLLSLLICSSVMAKTSFLAFGDSGYHYDYLKQKVIDNPKTPEQFVKDGLSDWLADYFPKSEFKAAPIYMLKPKHAIEASGMYPVAAAMEKFCEVSTCQFGIMLGDNIYPNGATGSDDEIRFKKMFEEPYDGLKKLDQNFKLYAALGNHDWKTSRIGRLRQIEYGSKKSTLFTMKDPGYYSFVRGEVEFFVLDTNLLLAGTTVYEEELNPDGSEKPGTELDTPEDFELPKKEDKKQLKWFKKSLKKSKAKWKIVYGHHTLWSSGGSKFNEARALRELIMKSICKYADAYIAGHEHELEINLDTCGPKKKPVPLIVSGAGAWQRGIHTPFLDHQKKTNPRFRSVWNKGMVWGFTHFEIEGDKMTVKMLTTPDNGQGLPVLERTEVFSNRK